MREDRHRRAPRGRNPEWRSSGLEGGFDDRFAHRRHGHRYGGHGGRGEGKRRFFERGQFKFALLELLASEPMHGYQLIKAMEEKTGGLYAPSAGSVYPNLQLLEDMSLIRSGEEEGKKLYRITEEGIAFLRERKPTDDDRPEEGWERRIVHRRPHGGKTWKRELHGLMKSWPDAIYALANAASAAREYPDSEQARTFRELMAKLQSDLKEIAAERE